MTITDDTKVDRAMEAVANVHNALVYDIGSATLLAGHAGGITADIIFPSVTPVVEGDLGFTVPVFDDSLLHSPTRPVPLADIIDDCYSISDPFLLASFLEFTHGHLSVDPLAFSAVYSQPSHLAGDHNRLWSHTLAELSFERFQQPAIAVISDSVLATYAHCLQTAVVVDFGWSCLRVVPVVEGRPIFEAIQVHPIGGYAFTRILSDQLQSRRISIGPRESELSPAQLEVQRRRVLENIIQTNCSYAPNTIDEDFLYFLQGRPVDVQEEMKVLASAHFNELPGVDGETIATLPQMIKTAVDKSPDGAKRILWENIVTSGGFSSLTSFIATLQLETRKVADSFFDVIVRHPMLERCAGRHTVWTGGSIFATSAVFPRFCVTREEWAESGDAILNMRAV
jgi:actin-related protein